MCKIIRLGKQVLDFWEKSVKSSVVVVVLIISINFVRFVLKTSRTLLQKMNKNH